jgi:rfaE bifunctional protein kinase chain/domain
MVRPCAAETHRRVPTILVVGDVIYDLYLNGTVPGAATAPVFHGASRLESLGGAANAAANLASLGNDVRLLGVVGAGVAGRRTREMLRECGIADTWVLEDLSRPTTQRTYLVAGGRQVLRLDTEGRTPLSVPLVARLLECVGVLLSQVDAVVCVDGGKGVCTPDLVDPLLAAARSAGRPVFVDCASLHPERYHEVTALVVRHDVPGLDVSGPGSDRQGAAQRLLERSRAQALVLAGVSDGLSLFLAPRIGMPSQRPLHFPVPSDARQDGGCASSDGSCQAVVAALCAGALSGLPMAEAARLAAAAAGVSARGPGTAVVSRADLPGFPAPAAV